MSVDVPKLLESGSEAMTPPAIAAFLRKLLRSICSPHSFNSFDSGSVRFSLRVGIPTLPVFADQIFVGFRQVGDLPGLAIVKQSLARPQGDGVQVNGL